jgi:hypothetical protein
MRFGLRQRVAEPVEEMLIEHEIAQTPADEGRAVGVRRQAFRGGIHQRPRRVAFAQWNVLHEA